MLGSFRFLLAWFVMLSHLPNSPFAKNFNLAVSAVIMFYFISGYLMYKSFKFKGNFFKSAKIFYLKRILRLFPLYLIVLFATILAISIFGKSELVPLLNQDLDAKKIFLNSILILNNYVFCPFEIDALLPHPLIPPTWSLSTEWHFYLLVPFLFFLINNKKWIFYLIFFLSLFFEWYAFFQTGRCFNSDHFGYRYIFGVLWIFMLGFLVSKEGIKKEIYFFIIGYFIFYGFLASANAYTREIFLGVFLTPIVVVLLGLNFKYDRLLGKLSYPIFLVHFLVFYLVEKLGFRGLLYNFVVFVGVIVFAYLLSLIQDRIDKIRKKIG